VPDSSATRHVGDPKSVKDNLTPAEKAALKTLTHRLKGEVSE
jgi:hypothetical protein